ncbi:hypothetical protein AB1E18_013941 [Capra hircus]
MAMPKICLSPVPWEQDGFLLVKMEEEEEASLSQVQESSFGHTVHPEAARLRFQHFCFEEASSPPEALAGLRELCRQWLQPETHSKEQMLELLVLEQFLGTRPPEIQSWVGAQCPKSGEGAAVLVEDLTRALDKRGKGGRGRLARRALGTKPALECKGADLDLGSLTKTLTCFGKQFCLGCQRPKAKLQLTEAKEGGFMAVYGELR